MPIGRQFLVEMMSGKERSPTMLDAPANELKDAWRANTNDGHGRLEEEEI